MTMWRTVSDYALLSTTLKEYVFPFETNYVFLLNYIFRAQFRAHKMFYESIETQSHALSCVPLVCLLDDYILYLLIASKQDQEDRLVKPSLAVLDHAQAPRSNIGVPILIFR